MRFGELSPGSHKAYVSASTCSRALHYPCLQTYIPRDHGTEVWWLRVQAFGFLLSVLA